MGNRCFTDSGRIESSDGEVSGRLREPILSLDAQMMNPHLERFGAYRVNEKQYQVLLQQSLQRRCSLV